MAKLMELPAWEPGVDVGDFVVSPPYAPAPENAVRADVAKGKAITFQMEMTGSAYYPPVAGRGGTFVNLRSGPDMPHGAWEFHENLIPKSEAKPLRIWLEVGQNDIGSTASAAGMRSWVLANIHMAEVPKAKVYAYLFAYAKEAGPVDRPVRAETLAPALEWVWKGCKETGK